MSETESIPENSRKRLYSIDSETSPASRPRLHFTASKDHKSEKSKFHDNRVKRLMTNCMTDDYLNLVGDIMYPKCTFESNNNEQKLPFDKISTLGFLLNPIRHRTVIEKWSPYDIAVFEASITLYGKNFHQIQKHIQTKTCKEIIEFYYEWKKTHHYEQWKSNYKTYFDERELNGAEDEN